MSSVDIGLIITPANVNGEEIQAWSEEKKKDFCKTFEAQSEDSRFILNLVGDMILSMAASRHFIPQSERFRTPLENLKLRVDRPYDDKDRRPYLELQRVAEQKAKSIIRELPSARKAVEVIDAETAKKMLQKEKIEEKLTALNEQYEDLDTEVSLNDCPEDWTIKQFKDHVASEIAKRERILKQINTLTKEGVALEGSISKALYKGLPGLKEAVAKVVKAHYEKANHLGTVTRRIKEKVLFGDSAAALELLSSFEENEVEVSESIRAEFTDAMKKLVQPKKTSKKVAKKAPRKK